ncbi:MAG: anion permease [Candidatus Omnitrophica bacterium]|nr:anion permease [Candidatus Omnitrophota bacterium]
MTGKNNYLLKKTFALIGALIVVVLLGKRLGFNLAQIITLAAFSLSILGTLLFWQFRLSFAFLGTTIMLFTGVAKLDEFIHHSSMEIILFLIGMMVLVGFLKEIGLFTWLLQKALIMKKISAKKFMLALIFASALLACAIDEVSSILFMIMIILELSDFFEVDPIPFIMTSVLATNIGSAGTVIGNPIGIMIAAKAGLSFENFLLFAFPLMVMSLFVLTGLIFIIFRKEIRELDEKIKEYGPNEILVQLLSVPTEKRLKIGFVIAGATLLLIAMHHRLELLLGLELNTILLMAPLLSAAIIMVWRRERARSYIENDVEWWTLLFFMFLFGQAGILANTGVAEVLAQKLLMLVASNQFHLIATVLFGSGIISSALDNVVVVAGSIPVIHSLNTMLGTHSVLWWALLFGACFGGNMTIIGSTANIVAIGALEKRRGISISFRYWFKIGAVVGLTTLAFILLAMQLLPYYR